MRHLADLDYEMQYVIGTTLSLFALATSLIAPMVAHSAPISRPIEVISDPHGVGNPTHYSILRGTTKITFSHPLVGQFTRAEISVREAKGTRLTRFLLSPDGKTYRPTLTMETPFEKHYSTHDAGLCLDPADAAKPEHLLKAIVPKVLDSETVAKIREQLTKANFFDASCFDPAISQEHRDSIMNATVDVIAKSTQNTSPEPKFLRCLEKHGYAHEAGAIEGVIKQSITDQKVNPRVRLACTADKKAKPGEFDDETRVLTIKRTLKPVRDDYAAKVFHELLHVAPIRDGVPLQAMEECCTTGDQCDILSAYAEKRRQGEKTIAVSETLNQKSSVLTSTATVLKGTDGEALVFGAQTPLTSTAENQSFAKEHATTACEETGTKKCGLLAIIQAQRMQELLVCPAPKSKSVASLNDLLAYALIPEARAANICDSIEKDGADVAPRVEAAIAKIEARTVSELVEKLPQTSPINWTPPSEPLPIRVAEISDDAATAPSNSSTRKPAPTRTIASVSPLPEEKSARRLGSTNNRSDVASGRATLLVDTMEKAAQTVKTALTPDKLDLLKVDGDKIFKADFKPKTVNPHYVVASFASKPILVGDIGDIKDLGFANPFANTKSGTTGDLASAVRPPKAASANSAATAKNQNGNTVNDDLGSGPVNTIKIASSVGAGNNAATGTATPVTTTPKREPSSKASTDFKTMDRGTLTRFITSSYRAVSGELENPDFINSCIANRVQILDHEGRRIGSMSPDAIFIYRADLTRLVQTRAVRK